MKTSLLYFPFFFLSLVFFACDTDAITFPDVDLDSILGHWDIDGGGTLHRPYRSAYIREYALPLEEAIHFRRGKGMAESGRGI